MRKATRFIEERICFAQRGYSLCCAGSSLAIELPAIAEDLCRQSRLLICSVTPNNPNKQYLLVPMTDEQIEAIEEARNGSNANLPISLAGLATVAAISTDEKLLEKLRAEGIVNPMPIESSYTSTLSIERERWLTVLQGCQRKKILNTTFPRHFVEAAFCSR